MNNTKHMNYNIHEIMIGKSSLFSWIISAIMLVLIIFIYPRMMKYWISVGTLEDMIFRRFFFILFLTFMSGFSIVFKKKKSSYEEWLVRNPWFSGTIVATLIEVYGFWISYRILQMSAIPEAVLLIISQWWIVGIAILMGITGQYLGFFVAQRWHKRSQSTSTPQQSQNSQHVDSAR